MSARKIGHSEVFPQLTAHSRSSRLGTPIPAAAVRVHKNGIEFRSASAIPVWTEMTVDVQIPGESHLVKFTGAVVACAGNRHAGYKVSMVFTNVTPKAQARLNAIPHSS